MDLAENTFITHERSQKTLMEGQSCGIPAEDAVAWQRVIILFAVNRQQPSGYLAHRSAICRCKENYTTYTLSWPVA